MSFKRKESNKLLVTWHLLHSCYSLHPKPSYKIPTENWCWTAPCRPCAGIPTAWRWLPQQLSWAATHIGVLKHIPSHWDALDHRDPTANWAIVPSCAQLCGWLLYGILRGKYSQLCCKTNLSTSQPKDRDAGINTDLQKVIHRTLQCCTAYSTDENYVGYSWICLNRCWNLSKIREVNRNKNPQSILLGTLETVSAKAEVLLFP